MNNELSKSNADLALTLAGLFETAGYLKMEISRQQKSTKEGRISSTSWVTPIIGYSDSAERKICYLQSLFGGGVHAEKRKQSYRWYVKSRKTLPLVRMIAPYAPSWRTCITAFLAWSQATTPEEKRGIAESLLARSPSLREPVKTVFYRSLVVQPAFIAGVFASR